MSALIRLNDCCRLAVTKQAPLYNAHFRVIQITPLTIYAAIAIIECNRFYTPYDTRAIEILSEEASSYNTLQRLVTLNCNANKFALFYLFLQKKYGDDEWYANYITACDEHKPKQLNVWLELEKKLSNINVTI